MITQTLPKTTALYNPFNCPVAEPVTSPVDISGARAWSGEIDEETLANELAEPCPLTPDATPEIDPDMFELVYTWFLA